MKICKGLGKVCLQFQSHRLLKTLEITINSKCLRPQNICFFTNHPSAQIVARKTFIIQGKGKVQARQGNARHGKERPMQGKPRQSKIQARQGNTRHGKGKAMHGKTQARKGPCKASQGKVKSKQGKATLGMAKVRQCMARPKQGKAHAMQAKAKQNPSKARQR